MAEIIRMSTAAVRGQEQWALAGDASIIEELRAHGSIEDAAVAVAEHTGGVPADVIAYLLESISSDAETGSNAASVCAVQAGTVASPEQRRADSKGGSKMTDLERALEHIGNSARKSSRSAAWAEAERAAEIAGVGVRYEEGSNFPDLELLEKDVRAALSDSIIVTRHAGLVAWLAERGITGEVKAQVGPDDVRGKRVYGVLPLHLAAEAAEVVTVDMPLLKPEQRGQDLTPAQMDAAGAVMTAYSVRRK